MTFFFSTFCTPDTPADFGTKTQQMNAFYMNNETDMCKLNGFASSDIQRELIPNSAILLSSFSITAFSLHLGLTTLINLVFAWSKKLILDS